MRGAVIGLGSNAVYPEEAVVSSTLMSHFSTFVQEAIATLRVPKATGELSLTGKFDAFLHEALGDLSEVPLQITQQAGTNVGIPDFRLDERGELLGWVEFKAVVGKDLTNLKGHDKRQRDLFVAGLHNVILTNGWQWELYQNSKRVKRATFDRDLFTTDTLQIVDEKAVNNLENLFSLFISFRVANYESVHGAVGALASRAKALKIAMVELGPSRVGGHLNQLRDDFKTLVYRNGQDFTWAKFVDSYVQIAAFGALLWRLEARTEISLQHQVGLRRGIHPLLSQCLEILWSPQSQVPSLKPLLEELCRTVNLIPLDLFTAAKAKSDRRKYVPDPIVHAYEPFFEKYDAAARETNGVFYTPVEVVQQIVSGVDELMRRSLDRPDGILDDSAQFLDPATGTGTFLLGLANEIAHEASKVGLPTDQVVHEVLTTRTSAFELFPGPYTIANQRLETLLRELGTPATERLPIYLTDTLAAPEMSQLLASGFGPAGGEILAERERADFVKSSEDILVVFGNPPWERMKVESGGWEPFTVHLMNQILQATPAERRRDLKSSSDLYVAFWAWALWALRSPEDRQHTVQAPVLDTKTNNGMVAFITNRTWIIGPSLIGLRKLVRSGVKEVWVYDLGGDARGGTGARSYAGDDKNVFNIQVGVAIVWLVFDREYEGAATVRYRRSFGKKAEKLAVLAEPFDPETFEIVEDDDIFYPVRWPQALDDAPSIQALFTYEPFTGIQSARDTSNYSPWGVDAADVYSEIRHTPRGQVVRTGSLGRWFALKDDARRRAAWETAVTRRTKSKEVPSHRSLDPKKVKKALYRPLDERYVYDDPAWIDWYREALHEVYAAGNTPTLITLPRDFGAGPLAIHSELLPEQHAFRGVAGGKGVFPLWLPGDGREDNGITVVGGRTCGLLDDVLEWARSVLPGCDVPAEAAYDYILAVLSAPAYAERYWRELEAFAPRVPFTEDEALAQHLAGLGQKLRTAWRKETAVTGLSWSGNGNGPLGPAELGNHGIQFENGREILGVSTAAWNFTISHYRVLPEWFAARTQWTANINQAKDALRTISAVEEMLRLQPDLNSAFDALTPPARETTR